MNLDRRRSIGSLISLVIAGAVAYWWQHGGPTSHETIVFIIVFAITAIIDLIFLIVRTSQELEKSVQRVESRLSELSK
jgi:hypothetical protein